MGSFKVRPATTATGAASYPYSPMAQSKADMPVSQAGSADLLFGKGDEGGKLLA